MATQGVGTYKLNSFWESGRLIFYEKASGHTTTGNVFILGHDYVQVGDIANAVDLKWLGTTTGTFTLDAAAHTLVMTGIATSTDGAVTISNTTSSTTTTSGALIVSGGVGIAKGLFVGEVVSVGTVCQPDASDGAALGTTSLMWSDLFLAATGVINFNAGDVTLTHSTGLLSTNGSVTTSGVLGYACTAALDPNSTRSNHAFAYGWRGDANEVTTTMEASTTQHLEPIAVNLNIAGANPSGTSTVNVFYQNLTHDTTDMAALRLKQADWYMSIKKNVLDVYNMQLETVFGAASITVGGEACLLGLVLDAGASAVTCASWRGINVTMRGAGTPATAQAIFIDGAADITLREAIWICGGGITAAIRLARVDNYANAPTNLLALPPAGYNPVSAFSGTGHGGTIVKIACLVGATPYYLLASTAPA